MEYLILIPKLLWFFVPVGVANVAPVFMQHHWKFLAVPVDFNTKLSGKPIFGDHKTWRGLISATLFGGIAFILQFVLTQQYPVLASWAPFDITVAPWWFGFLFAFAGISGDLLKSFFKRRFDIAPGAVWFPFDQIDLYILSTIAASFWYPLTAVMVVMIFAFGIIAHILANHAGYWLGIKDSAW